MKTLTTYIFIIILAAACSQKGTESKNVADSKQIKDLKTIAPPNAVGDVRLSSQEEQKQSSGLSGSAPTSSNRIQLSLDNKLVVNNTQFESEIVSVEKGKIEFSNNALLLFWNPEFHNLLARKSEKVKVVFTETFIGGAVFYALKITGSDQTPILHVASLGGNSPIQVELYKGFSVLQQEKETVVADNESERIGEVQTLLNKNIPLSKNKPLEVKIGSAFYTLSVNQSLHYYPKGTDSVESPPFYLEYTLTRVK